METPTDSASWTALFTEMQIAVLRHPRLAEAEGQAHMKLMAAQAAAKAADDALKANELLIGVVSTFHLQGRTIVIRQAVAVIARSGHVSGNRYVKCDERLDGYSGVIVAGVDMATRTHNSHIGYGLIVKISDGLDARHIGVEFGFMALDSTFKISGR